MCKRGIKEQQVVDGFQTFSSKNHRYRIKCKDERRGFAGSSRQLADADWLSAI